MPSSKKKTIKDWQEDLYVIYLQDEIIFNLMDFKTFINYAKNNNRFESLLGYKWQDIEQDEVR